MPNSKNKEEWVNPTNIPKPIRNTFLGDDDLGSLLTQIANLSTLEQMTTAVWMAYEEEQFLEDL